jgi:hypothetical protein
MCYLSRIGMLIGDYLNSLADGEHKSRGDDPNLLHQASHDQIGGLTTHVPFPLTRFLDIAA